MWDFVSIAGLVILAVVIAVILVGAAYYLMPPAFRFWFLDIWADLPVIGTVARLARMSEPSTKEANTRLDKLFKAYHNHIQDPLPKADYDSARKYLSLAGDSDARPTPFHFRLLLIALMVAEAFTFSFLLGVSISAEISEELAEILAVVLAFVLAVLFGALGHPAGHALRRTHTLRAAWRGAIGDMELAKGEKTHRELTEQVDLDDPQDQDQPRKHNFDSQRFLNRARKGEHDRGSYFLPAAFVLAVVASAYFQYELRAGSSFVSDLLNLPGQGGQGAPASANSFFVLIFVLTQGLAMYLGYKYDFLGRESARAYRIVGGRDTHRDYMREFEARERRADESLGSLLAKFRRYNKVTPAELSYRERSERQAQGGKTPPPPPRPKTPRVELVPSTKDGSGG